MQLLDEAGYQPDANGVRLRVNFIACNCQSSREMATVYAEHLREIGVELEIQSFDIPAYAEQVIDKREFEVAYGGGPAGPDPSLFHPYVVTDGARNIMGTAIHESTRWPR